MKSIYISLPISGYDLDERKAAAKKAKEKLAAKYPEAAIITPFDVCDEPGHTYEHYMGRDIEALLKCDAIYMCAGCAGSKGCRAEHAVAFIYGKTVLFEDPDSQPADNGDYIVRGKSLLVFRTKDEAVNMTRNDFADAAKYGQFMANEIRVLRQNEGKK